MTLEALRAADILSKVGVEVDVIDVRTIRPLDTATIVDSVKRTGRLVIADTGHVEFGVSSEISASVVEHAFDSLTSSPIRVGLPEYPTPTGISLAKNYYPTAREIVAACLELTDRAHLMSDLRFEERWNSDQPDTDFSGPF
jgi:pyruvate dehydrogenase E1 component beta subunit